MIHQYKNNGYNIVLDVNSGSVHVVDDMVYDVIACIEEDNLENIDKITMYQHLKKKFTDRTEDLSEIVDEIYELKENGMLFQRIFMKRVLKSLKS